MTYADSILPEFDMEMANTRKVLERIPTTGSTGSPIPSRTRSAGTPIMWLTCSIGSCRS